MLDICLVSPNARLVHVFVQTTATTCNLSIAFYLVHVSVVTIVSPDFLNFEAVSIWSTKPERVRVLPHTRRRRHILPDQLLYAQPR